MGLPPQPVLQQFGLESEAAKGGIESLGANGGFSGARFWRIGTADRPLCLRRWPSEHPSLDQLRFIHAALRHATNDGFRQIPAPLPNLNGETIVEHRSHLWELTPWLAGEANFVTQPSENKLRSAAHTLADLHLSLASFSGNHWGPSYSIEQRRQLLKRYQPREVAILAEAVRENPQAAWYHDAQTIVQLFATCKDAIEAPLLSLHNQSHLQPCIRDLWHDNILYQGDRVSGIVDFGAMRFDHRATDLARMVGSMAGDDQKSWHVALSAYDERCPLDEEFRRRLAVLDRTTVLLSGMNWLWWIYREQRHFPDWNAVTQRIQETCRRLQHLNQHRDERHFALEVA